MYTEMVNLDLKAEKQIPQKKHTKDWALGFHPDDNSYVIH